MKYLKLFEGYFDSQDKVFDKVGEFLELCQKYNLIRKSKYYKDLDYEEKVEALNNENLWYYDKFNFKRKDKKNPPSLQVID